jgi:RNA polymerase II-associated protein 3
MLAAQRAELRSKLPAGTEIDDNLLNIATGMQMVENIALLSNSKDYGFIGVNMYVDDEGSVRGCARNIRATEIAHCCGKPIEVKGDAFLARVLDDGDNFERRNLFLNEISSESEWVQQAKIQAARRREADSSAEVMRRIQVESAAKAKVRELTPAEAAKEEGNTAFKKGLWDEAIQYYTKAIELDTLMIAALNNRAMAHLKLERWEEALIDCLAVLERQPSNVKALLRAAASEVELGKKDEAKQHLESALLAEPSNIEAKKRLDELNSS